MQEKFGNDYQKYIFEETRTQSIDIAENDTEPRTWVTFYEDSFYMERVSLTANWFILPWGSFNAVDMTTWETRKGDTTIEYPAFVQRLDLYMADDETNKSKTAFNSSYLAIVGDSKVGFFPKYPLHLSQLAKVTDPKAGPSGSRTWVLNWW